MAELKTAESGARILGVSVQRFYELVRTGILPPGVVVRLGRLLLRPHGAGHAEQQAQEHCTRLPPFHHTIRELLVPDLIVIRRAAPLQSEFADKLAACGAP